MSIQPIAGPNQEIIKKLEIITIKGLCDCFPVLDITHTQECIDQNNKIQDFFKDVALELRKTWGIFSKFIAEVITKKQFKTVGFANMATSVLVRNYKIDNFTNLDPNSIPDQGKKPWIDFFKQLLPHANRIYNIKIEELSNNPPFNPLVLQKLAVIQTESIRLVNGTSEPNKAYVENKLSEETDAKVVSQPWTAPVLKA